MSATKILLVGGLAFGGWYIWKQSQTPTAGLGSGFGIPGIGGTPATAGDTERTAGQKAALGLGIAGGVLGGLGAALAQQGR